MKKIKILIAKFLGWLMMRRGLRWTIKPALKAMLWMHRPRLIKKQKAKIYRVLAVTPGRRRAWVESSAGIIKKPLGSIPARLLKEHAGYDRAQYLRFMQAKTANEF